MLGEEKTTIHIFFLCKKYTSAKKFPPHTHPVKYKPRTTIYIYTSYNLQIKIILDIHTNKIVIHIYRNRYSK